MNYILKMIYYYLFIVFSLINVISCASNIDGEDFDRDPGRALGFIPMCSTFNKSVVISKSYLNKHLKFSTQVQAPNGKMLQKKYTYKNAARSIRNDPTIDLKNRKTLVFATGWIDSTEFLAARVVANSYAKMGYNVILVDTFSFTAFYYPIAASFANRTGQAIAKFLIDLKVLKPENVLFIGISLGGQIIGLAGKHYYKETGKRISHILALDPAGPCFRQVPPDQRLSPDDAEFVQVMHTNIDGLGLAEPVGDVDFYVNGGEYQIAVLPQLPCLDLCSHIRSYELLNGVLAFPDKFVGVKCKNVQQAREYTCYNNQPRVTNVMGMNADKTKRGVYLVPTLNKWPFYVGMEGIKRRHYPGDIYLSYHTNSDTVELNQDFWKNAPSLFSTN